MAGQITKRRTCFKYPQNIPKSDTILTPATTGSITQATKMSAAISNTPVNADDDHC